MENNKLKLLLRQLVELETEIVDTDKVSSLSDALSAKIKGGQAVPNTACTNGTCDTKNNSCTNTTCSYEPGWGGMGDSSNSSCTNTTCDAKNVPW